MTTERKRQFIIDVFFVIVIVAIAYFILKYLLGWLLPFILAFIIARCTQGPIDTLARRTHISKKILSPILTFILVFIILFVCGTLIYSAVVEIISLVSQLPALYEENSPAFFAALTQWFNSVLGDLPDEIEALLRNMTSTISESIQSWLLSLSSWALSTAASAAAKLPSLLVALILTLVASFFISGDYDNIRSFARIQIPLKFRGVFHTSLARFGHTVGQMARSYALIMGITFIELFLGLTLLRLNHAMLLAALISLVDILPVLGIGTILLPWSIISLVMGRTSFGLKLIAVYVVITLIRNFIEPKIIGNRIGLNPLVTMIFMYIGLQLMGLVGVFLFPLTIILINDMQRNGILHIWNTKDELRRAAPADAPVEPPADEAKS